MARYRFKTELISPALGKLAMPDVYTESIGTADEVGVKLISTIAAIVPLIGFLLPSAMNIFQGGVGSLYAQDGARVYQPYRLTPEVVYRLWWKLHKGEGSPSDLLDDLLAQGWSPNRIEQGKEASKIMPTPQDIVNFLAHEVFESGMIAKYGLDSEWETIDKEWAKKIGLDEETLHLYWLNHWQHPSLTSVFDMLHRELLGVEDVQEYYKLVEIPEYWRGKLTELSWDVPNRIETRMMTRYLDLPKSQVEKMLQYAGLKEEFRSDAADFMMIMGLQGYWSTMYRNGWLTSDELRAEIEAKDVSPDVAERVYKYIVKAEKPERTAKERDLTKTEIYRGIKKNRIERAFGIALIRAMGYDEWEAKLLVNTNVPPDTEDGVTEQRELTKADILKGLKVKEIQPDEAITRLVAQRYTIPDASLLVRIYTAVVEKPTEESKRQESKADIIKGVKRGIITNEEGYLRLLDIGFAPEASEFILSVQVEESPFSPASPSEFVEMVNNYRRSLGMDVHELTEAAIQAEKSYIEAEAKLRSARDTGAPQAEILQLEALRDELKARFETAIASSQEA